MVFWPKVDVNDIVKFKLQGQILSVVNEIKYLGVIISCTLGDDLEMAKRARAIYASGNMLISKFKHCKVNCKTLLFKTYCYNVYGLALWASYRIPSYAKAKIAHNDIFRTLLNVPRYESASTLFVQNRTLNLDSIRRNAIYCLIDRLLSSENCKVEGVCRSEVKMHSKTWKRWAIELGTNWDALIMN